MTEHMGQETIEPQIKAFEENKAKLKEPKLFMVIMFNDDFTTMEFVITVLVDIFNKTVEEANNIMLAVHEKGQGIAGIYPYDIALTKMSLAISAAKKEDFPFKLAIEEAEK